MVKENQRKLINLLPQEEFEASIAGRVLRWAMTTFRFLVIATEMIVMSAFLSRFWLDAKSSDLNDLLEIRKAQVVVESDFEASFKSLQERLRIFQELTKNTKFSEILTKLASKTPAGVNLQTVSFQDTSAIIKGVSESELNIAQLISNLKAEAGFDKVTLGQINSSEADPALIVFNIKITF